MRAQLKDARKTIWLTLEVTGHCLWQSILHPGRQISQVSNPVPVQVSPIPWWGCTVIILVGIGSWIVAALLEQVELREASRLLVYMPIMHLFDMGYYTAKQVHKSEKR